MIFGGPTLSEPRSDIEAQLLALIDPASPKAAVFISAHNEPESIPVPSGCYYGDRQNGRLICSDKALAEWFASTPHVSDAEMTELLGYPQSKACSMAHLNPTVIQIRNTDGAVIQECAVDAYDLDRSVTALWPYVGSGSMKFMTLTDAILRRVQLQRTNDGS